jgi:hypothetical protein
MECLHLFLLLADINARGIGMHYFEAEVFALHFPYRPRRCLRFISCQWCCVGWLVALLVGPFSFFRTTPAAIYTIARTGAMLSIGQERSRENAALAAEPGCASDFSSATP